MTGTLRVARVRLDDVRFHPHNVRRDLGDLRSLAASIKRFGVMQPIVVEDCGDALRLRAGHRRCAAARLAGIDRVPAVIHAEPLDDDEWLLASLAENRQRRGLDTEEMRRTCARLMELGCTQQGIADACGVTSGAVAGWLKPKAAPAPPRADGPAPVKGREQLVASMVRQFIDGWAEHDGATVDDVLDGLEQLLGGEPLQVAMPSGWTPPPRTGRPVGMRLDFEKLAELEREGLSAAEIGVRLGVTGRTIVRARRALETASKQEPAA